MKKRALQFIGGLIWNASERLDVPLGRFAPIVFGWMIGSKGVRVDEPEMFMFEADPIKLSIEAAAYNTPEENNEDE